MFLSIIQSLPSLKSLTTALTLSCVISFQIQHMHTTAEYEDKQMSANCSSEFTLTWQSEKDQQQQCLSKTLIEEDGITVYYALNILKLGAEFIFLLEFKKKLSLTKENSTKNTPTVPFVWHLLSYYYNRCTEFSAQYYFSDSR